MQGGVNVIYTKCLIMHQNNLALACGGKVVSVVAFYTSPSLNPADDYSFSVKFVFEKRTKRNKKRPGWPLKKNLALYRLPREAQHKSKLS